MVYKLIEEDSWLEPYEGDLHRREELYNNTLAQINEQFSSLMEISRGYKYFGFNEHEAVICYREWAPEANNLFLIGDFNEWDRYSHALTKYNNGVWEITLSEADSARLRENSRVKVHVSSDRDDIDRIPAYIREVEKEADSVDFCGLATLDSSYQWKHESNDLGDA